MPRGKSTPGHEYNRPRPRRPTRFWGFHPVLAAGNAHHYRGKCAGVCGDGLVGRFLDGSERAAGDPLGREFWSINVERPMVAAIHVYVRPLWFFSYRSEHVVPAESGGRSGTDDGAAGVQRYVSVQWSRGQRRQHGVESVARLGGRFRRYFRNCGRVCFLFGAEEGGDSCEPGAAKSAEPGGFHFVESFDRGSEWAH